VTKTLEIIHRELDLTMAFCGHRQVGELSADNLIRADHVLNPYLR